MKLSERAAVTLLFFLNGAIFSSFFARLPAIKADLGASDGELGVALFFATGGLVVAQPLAGMLSARLGAKWPGLGGLALYALGLPAAAAAPSVAALAGVLFLMGLANGVLDVAINVEGVAVERRERPPGPELDARRVLVRRDDRGAGWAGWRPRRGWTLRCTWRWSPP